MLGDLKEVTFRGSAELEQLVERALDAGVGYRFGVLKRITPRIREFLTYDGVCTQILHLISNRLQA